MTGDEHDALAVLERLAHKSDGAFEALTAYRAGGTLVEALVRALEAVALDPPDWCPSDEQVRSAERYYRDARAAADEAETAADEAGRIADDLCKRVERAENR